MGWTICRYIPRIWYENISLYICGVDRKTTLTRYTMVRWEYDNENVSPNLSQGMLIFISAPIWNGKLRFISAPIWKRKLRFISVLIWKGKFRFILLATWKGKLIFISDTTSKLMAPYKAASDPELKSNAQGTTIKTSLMSYAMRGDYTVKNLAYGIHTRGVRLVELVGAPLAK